MTGHLRAGSVRFLIAAAGTGEYLGETFRGIAFPAAADAARAADFHHAANIRDETIRAGRNELNAKTLPLKSFCRTSRTEPPVARTQARMASLKKHLH